MVRKPARGLAGGGGGAGAGACPRAPSSSVMALVLAAAQVAVVYRFRHIFRGPSVAGASASHAAAGGGSGASLPPCGPARYCDLAEWAPGRPLPAWFAEARAAAPTDGFITEWPPERGPDFVPMTPGLDHLIRTDNDPAQRAAWGGRWRTPVVVVPSVYTEYDATVPGWVVASLWSRFRSLFVYQRTDPARPRFAPNFGTESGVYYRFIVDHYDDLPDHVVFVHMYPEAHNERWLEWVHAMRPNLTFSSLNDFFVEARLYSEVMQGSPWSFFAEQCLRDIFEDVGATLPAKEPLVANGWCCAQVVASRAQIRMRPKAAYEKILRRIGTPPGLCHLGAPPRNDTWWDPSDPSQFSGDEVYDGFTGYGKQVVGHATEYSLSTVIGGVRLWEPQTTWPEYCWHFHHQCAYPGSPCKGPNQRPLDLCPGAPHTGVYPSDDELEPEVEIAWCPEAEGVPPDDPACPSHQEFLEDQREEEENMRAMQARREAEAAAAGGGEGEGAGGGGGLRGSDPGR